ncbi:MAG: alanine--glyoxylate aminotransferase family protein [Thermoplasmata archaeon]|nr:alanine--glyoxylate aminotransferase family protein [Thermoplasmata archaeon]
MVFDMHDNIFMLAGPVKIHPRVLKAMNTPSIGHRSPEFTAINEELRELTKYLFQTKGEVAIITGSGTAGMEAAISSLVKKGDKILAIDNGKFGNRMATLAKMYGDATILTYPWGSPPDLGKIEEILSKGETKVMAFVHNETSTGLTNPLEDIAKICKKHDVLLVVDGITSVGGIDVPVDKLGIDICITGSQKCVAAPAGLALLSISERALEEMHDNGTYYLNLKKYVEKIRGGQTPYTPSVHLHLALLEALRMLKEEGLHNRIKRTARIAEACRSAMEAIGLELFPDKRYASNTVTAVKYPDGITDKQIRGRLKEEYGIVIAGSQAPHKGEFFRIGHMGLVQFRELLATVACLEVVLAKAGWKFDRGAGVAAVEEYM